jgi:hypothetical protein
MEERKRHYDKARVYASGELVEVKCTLGYMDHNYETEDGRCFSSHELDFKCEPDYWTRLEHQYAGMAMQGLILTASKHQGTDKEVAQWAEEYATALVEKLKSGSNGN